MFSNKVQYGDEVEKCVHTRSSCYLRVVRAPGNAIHWAPGVGLCLQASMAAECLGTWR